MVTLRNELVPEASVALYQEVAALIQIAATREIAHSDYTQSVFQLYLDVLPDLFWTLKAFIDPAFITADDLNNASLAAATAIVSDINQVGSQIVTHDLATFTDILNH